MDLKKIKIGKRVAYESRAHRGTGKVTDIQTKLTGAWVTVMDPTRNKFLTLRPSQVEAA
jgi:hypothetical protein